MFRKTYIYVDFTTGKARRGFRKWKRISLYDLSKYLSDFQYLDVYITIQRYKNPAKVENEEVWHGIYFDFDADNLEEAREDALKVVDYFRRLGVPKELIRIHFSGHRGFHIYIEPEIFGIRPHPHLPYIVKLVCIDVAEFLNLKCFDRNVYTIARMWRVPDTINAKTSERRYKIELYEEELEKLSIDEILELAKEPRGSLWKDIDYENIYPDLDWWFDIYVKRYNEIIDIARFKPKDIIKIKENPVCVEDILKNFFRRKGDRNKALVVLTSFFKDKGMAMEEVVEILSEWSLRIPYPSLTDRSERERIANVKSVVKTIYDNPENYHFSCPYIRSLGTPDNPVKCLRSACNLTSYEPVDPIEIKLEEATKSYFKGVYITSKGICAGVDYQPSLIPSVIRMSCSGRGDACQNCVLQANDYRLEITLSEKDEALLRMVDVSTDMLYNVICRIVGIKNCKRLSFEFIDYFNVVDCSFVPYIKYAFSGDQNRHWNIVEAKYITKGQDILINKEYNITGKLVADPKNQRALLLVNKLEELKGKYELTEDLKERLNVFRTEDNPLDKLFEIAKDLEVNVTKIYNRELIHIVIDLIYHTPLAFRFVDKPMPIKGCGEALIIGDTDTGKTTLAKALINHYELGSYISCETATRTGLLYSIQETGNKWFIVCGTLPLNDGGLCFLDEFMALNMKDRRELTQIRSEGILQISRVRQTLIPCRVRLIYLATPSKMLSEYGFGILAVNDVFDLQEDMRRIDIVATMSSADVDKEIFKKKMEKTIPHIYTSDICNALIRFNWSLSENSIKFTNEAINEVYEQVNRLSQMFVDTPILKIEDLRYKIARLGIAVAGRTYNVDENYYLVVEARHIKAVGDLMVMLYSQPSSGYRELSFIEKSEFSNEQIDRIINEYIQFENKKEFIIIMLKNDSFDKEAFNIMLSSIVENERDAQILLSKLVMAGLLIKKRKSYYKTETFNNYLKATLLKIEKEEKDVSAYE